MTLGTARALAALDLRVIAIEADLRRPTFAKYGIGRGSGLSTVLAGVSDVDGSLIEVDASTLTRVDGALSARARTFHVLPAGPVPPNPQALLARPMMTHVIEDARAMADVVLVDVPPLGTVNDPVTLANLVDGVVLVAHLGRTTRDASRRTLRLLANVDARLLGVVVTGARARRGLLRRLHVAVRRRRVRSPPTGRSACTAPAGAASGRARPRPRPAAPARSPSCRIGVQPPDRVRQVLRILAVNHRNASSEKYASTERVRDVITGRRIVTRSYILLQWTRSRNASRFIATTPASASAIASSSSSIGTHRPLKCTRSRTSSSRGQLAQLRELRALPVDLEPQLGDLVRQQRRPPGSVSIP